MKILIICSSKIKFMPYVFFYLNNIKKSNNKIHIIIWNRDLKEEKLDKLEGCIIHEFRRFQEDEVPVYTKIFSFIRFKHFVKKTIKGDKYDFIFVLDTIPAVLMHNVLLHKFRYRYVFDYRDSTYEQFYIYKKAVADIVKYSKTTFVSSDAFRQFLPEQYADKTITSHNIMEESLLHRNEKKLHGIFSDKIRIAFWGIIRQEEINLEIIKKIAQDNRFELHYYGREQEIANRLKQYCREIQSNNVFFHGEYNTEERYSFARETDIIHNIYYDSNTMLAMGNKFYDGIIFRIPQICMPGSFMGKLVTDNGIGIELNPYDDEFCNKIYRYYSSMDNQLFEKSCDDCLEKVLKDYNLGKEIVNNISEGQNT